MSVRDRAELENLTELLESAYAADADRVAVADERTIATYRELERAARRLASWLQEKDLRDGLWGSSDERWVVR